jgi:hypothetical protein
MLALEVWNPYLSVQPCARTRPSPHCCRAERSTRRLPAHGQASDRGALALIVVACLFYQESIRLI